MGIVPESVFRRAHLPRSDRQAARFASAETRPKSVAYPELAGRSEYSPGPERDLTKTTELLWGPPPHVPLFRPTDARPGFRRSSMKSRGAGPVFPLGVSHSASLAELDHFCTPASAKEARAVFWGEASRNFHHRVLTPVRAARSIDDQVLDRGEGLQNFRRG